MSCRHSSFGCYFNGCSNLQRFLTHSLLHLELNKFPKAKKLFHWIQFRVCSFPLVIDSDISHPAIVVCFVSPRKLDNDQQKPQKPTIVHEDSGAFSSSSWLEHARGLWGTTGSRAALGALSSWLVVFDGVVAGALRTAVSTAREADWRWLGECRPGGQSSEERMVGGLWWSGRRLRAPEP
jgi:hypothetical protein